MRRLLAVVLLLSACPDYDLEDRRFTCEERQDCGAGYVCLEGFCARRETCGNQLDDNGDGLADCRDPQCGEASCDDENACTVDACASDGRCESDLPAEPECGEGCVCVEGLPTEDDCNDEEDDDLDGAIDCDDPDCAEPPCA